MKLKEEVKGVLGVALLLIIMLLGIVIVNARLGSMQNKSAVVETTTHTNTNLKS